MDSELMTTVLAIFGAIACVGGGVGYLSKLFQWIKKPNDNQDVLLKSHTELLNKHADLLDKNSKRLTELEEQDKLVMQALLALLSHGIDGNDVNAMKSVKDQIQKYLIAK